MQAGVLEGVRLLVMPLYAAAGGSAADPGGPCVRHL